MQKRTGTPIQRKQQNFSKQGPDAKPAWTGKSVKILSAFADTEQAPNLTEGIKLLAGKQSAQVKTVYVSEWRLDKLGKWSNEAQELLFKIAQGHFDVVWITMPTKGYGKVSFHNAEGPAPQRNWLYPHGVPWLAQQGKRAADAVTVNAAIVFVLAFAAMTQKGTGMVLTTSEERGDAHRGEPCSWWQAAETKHLATLGATRSAVYTCGLAQKWRLGKTTRPGPVGIMTNFDCSSSLLTGWPSFNDKKGYTGPLSKQCSCCHNHKAEKQERTKKTATHPVTRAEIMSALPRLPEGHGELNRTSGRYCVNHIFSVLADADSPANFLLGQLPWLQAAYRVMHEGPNTREVQGKGAEQNSDRAEEMKGRGNKREKEEGEEDSWSMTRRRRSVVEAREHGRRGDEGQRGGTWGQAHKTLVFDRDCCASAVLGFVSHSACPFRACLSATLE